MQSWESLPLETATFTSDITPLILAAHRDNYEIIKILLDRGATLPMPHDVRYVWKILFNFFIILEEKKKVSRNIEIKIVIKLRLCAIFYVRKHWFFIVLVYVIKFNAKTACF